MRPTTEQLNAMHPSPRFMYWVETGLYDWDCCSICGARADASQSEPCDEWAHAEHEEAQRLIDLAATVVCLCCGEGYGPDGCPCGEVEPVPADTLAA